MKNATSTETAKKQKRIGLRTLDDIAKLYGMPSYSELVSGLMHAQEFIYDNLSAHTCAECRQNNKLLDQLRSL